MPHDADHTRVLVLMGGPDAEHDVSVMSGHAIGEALRQDPQVDVQVLCIKTITAAQILAMNPDVIFPALHGPWGEGGPLQEILEVVEQTSGSPFVGCGSAAAALAMDKWLTKQHLTRRCAIPTPLAALFDPHADPCPIPAPVVLKPIDDGSSVGVDMCPTEQHLRDAIQRLVSKPAGPIMAERLVQGRELTVGLLFGRSLPLIEIIPAVKFYDHEAKYYRDDTQYILDPPLSEQVTKQCHLLAEQAFDSLGCRDLARADFMLDDDGLWLLEVNTMPGFTAHSLLPMAARHAGLQMPALCGQLIRSALSRGTRPAAQAADVRALV